MRKIISVAVFFLITLILIACVQRSLPEKKPSLPETIIRETEVNAKEPWQVEWERTIYLARKEGKVVVYMEATIGSRVRDPIMKVMKEKF